MSKFQKSQRIGRFTIVELIGMGGFGEAYVALDLELDRQVVLKCLREDLAFRLGGDPDLVQEIEARFWIEARAQARITHPNVCTIFDVDDRNKIIVMEYIEGKTLDELRGSGPLSKMDIIDIAIQVGESISEAHDRNILHRDLTLHNIMLSHSKRVKVLDFGLAKLTDKRQFTKFAPVIGTPPYMSPEQQLRPEQVDVRSDVYSFGVVLYRLVTGHYPYAKTFVEEPEPAPPPPFSSFGVDPWPDLNHTVRSALQIEPNDRFDNLRDMVGELIKVRESLFNGGRELAFFDASALMEVVCPPLPTAHGRDRAKAAQNEFEVHHANLSAVSSPGVLLELLESILKLYFDSEERGLKKDRRVQDVVADVKDDLKRERKRDARSGKVTWVTLSADEKGRFFRGVKGLFLHELHAVAAQLTPVTVDNHLLLSKFIEFTALRRNVDE